MHTKALVSIIKKSTCGPAYLPIKKGSQTSFFLFYVKGLKTCHPPHFFFIFLKSFTLLDDISFIFLDFD
jgi:hypothetical protein